MLPAEFTPGFLRQLELLKLRARRAFLGTRQGGHISLKRGHGIEFSDYRKYELGDNPRHIDWGVYARSERLYVKRFQEEQEIGVHFILDGSASMNTELAAEKWQSAKSICLALAYIALMQHDRVTCSVPGRGYSPGYTGGKALYSLSDFIDDLEFSGNPDFIYGLQQCVSRIRFPGVAILISDFLMPLELVQKAINLLRSKNLDIRVIQLLGELDVNPSATILTNRLVDSETGAELDLQFDQDIEQEYGFLLMQHNRQLREFLEDGNIPYIMTVSSQSTEDFIIKNLVATGLLR